MSFLNIDIQTLLFRALVMLLVIPIHEFSHGYVAYKLGDRTAKLAGRLTLNPISHLDPIGSVLLLFTGFGFAKPVPVNPRNFKNPTKDMVLTSLAGPLSNFIAAFLGMILFKVLLFTGLTTGALGTVASIVQMFVFVNIGLGVFNLIPVPPLDGFKIISPLLPNRIKYEIQRNQQVISIVLLILVVIGVRLGLLSGLMYWMFDIIDFLTGFVNLLLL